MASNGKTVELVAKEERQHRVAGLYLQRKTLREIGRVVGASHSMVSADLKAIRKMWVEQSTKSMEVRTAEELARIDKLEATYWEAWERSCQPQESTHARLVRVESPGGSTSTPDGPITGPPIQVEQRSESGKRTTTATGDSQYLAGVERCITLRAKILGLFAPEKREVSGPGGAVLPITMIEIVSPAANNTGASVIDITPDVEATDAGDRVTITDVPTPALPAAHRNGR